MAIEKISDQSASRPGHFIPRKKNSTVLTEKETGCQSKKWNKTSTCS